MSAAQRRRVWGLAVGERPLPTKERWDPSAAAAAAATAGSARCCWSGAKGRWRYRVWAYSRTHLRSATNQGRNPRQVPRATGTVITVVVVAAAMMTCTRRARRENGRRRRHTNVALTLAGAAFVHRRHVGTRNSYVNLLRGGQPCHHGFMILPSGERTSKLHS